MSAQNHMEGVFFLSYLLVDYSEGVFHALRGCYWFPRRPRAGKVRIRSGKDRKLLLLQDSTRIRGRTGQGKKSGRRRIYPHTTHASTPYPFSTGVLDGPKKKGPNTGREGEVKRKLYHYQISCLVTFFLMGLCCIITSVSADCAGEAEVWSQPMTCSLHSLSSCPQWCFYHIRCMFA